MNDTCLEQLVDVRPMPPRIRHSTIFAQWQQLEDGGSILLVNDHDPLPLFYQFSCEHSGAFRWQYLDQGPEVWRVRITKGRFSDPGFKPAPSARASCAPAAPISFTEPLVLDTRPIFQRGDHPCGAIDEAAAQVIPGQPLILLVPFEPRPLYAKLGAQGFKHTTTQEPDGSWRIEFRR